MAEAVGPSSADLNDELLDILFDDDDVESFNGFSTGDKEDVNYSKKHGGV